MQQNKKSFSKLFAFIPLIVFLAIAGIFLSRLDKDSTKLPSPFIGKTLPYFQGKKLGEYPLLNHSDIGGGKVTVINVFASWCVPCLQEHPQITALSKIVQTYGLAWKDKQKNSIKWLNKNGNAYHKIVSDLKGRAGIDIGVYGVPETFVMDKAGILQYRHTGAITPQDLTDTILPLIKQLQAQ